VIEHALRESLAGSCLAEIGSETEGLGNGKVRLDLENGGSDTLLLLDNATTTPVQASVDSTNGLLGASDVHEVDGLQETRLGCEAARVHDTTGSGHDLTGTAVDRVGVHGNIQQVPTDTAAILLGKNTLLGGDLEAADNGVLNFVEVLHGLGGVDDKVGAGGFGSETPDLAGIVDVPFVLLVQDLGTSLLLITRGDGSLLNLLDQFLLERAGNHVQAVVLVGRLGKAGLIRGTDDSLAVGNNGIRNLDFSAAHKVLGKIVQADLQMQLTSASNNVLSGLFDGALH